MHRELVVAQEVSEKLRYTSHINITLRKEMLAYYYSDLFHRPFRYQGIRPYIGNIQI